MSDNTPNASPGPRRSRILPPLRRDEASPYGGNRRVINPAGLAARIALGAVALAATVFVLSGLTNVGATERAVVFHGGDGSLAILEPGKFQWVTPILNDVTVYGVRDTTYTKPAIGISLDLQETTTEVTVRYHPDVVAIQTIHQTLGRDYEEKAVAPSVQGCVKNAVSFYNVEELTGAVRARVVDDISDCIARDAAVGHLVVTRITVTDFDFSEQFNQAVERRAVAQQAAQEAKNLLERSKYLANITVVEATANADAARLVNQATAGQQGAAYLYLEWLRRWDGHLPATLVTNGETGIMLAPGPTLATQSKS